MRNPRLTGILMLAIGGFLSWIAVWQPLQDAWAHADHLSLSMKGVAIAPICLIYGIVYLLAPAPLAQMLSDKSQQHPLKWMLLLVSLVSGFGFYFMFRGYLSSFGYHFNGF